MVIPVIIMGGILTGWFTPTEAGMVAAFYILLVLIPILRPRHVWQLPKDFMYTGLLYSLPLAAVAGASAFGWMLAYLRGPDTVAGYIEAYAGTDPRMIMFLLVLLFILVGDFVDAVPAIIIFMPIILKLTALGNINSLHMGVVIITTLVFGLITPPYGLSLLIAAKFVGVPFYRAMVRSFPLYVVFLVTIGFCMQFPERRAVAAEAAAAGIGRLLQEPQRDRIHLSVVGWPPPGPRAQSGPGGRVSRGAGARGDRSRRAGAAAPPRVRRRAAHLSPRLASLRAMGHRARTAMPATAWSRPPRQRG